MAPSQEQTLMIPTPPNPGEPGLVDPEHWPFVLRTLAAWYERAWVESGGPEEEDQESVRWFLAQMRMIADHLAGPSTPDSGSRDGSI